MGYGGSAIILAGDSPYVGASFQGEAPMITTTPSKVLKVYMGVTKRVKVTMIMYNYPL